MDAVTGMGQTDFRGLVEQAGESRSAIQNNLQRSNAMKKTALLFGIGLCAALLSVTLAPRSAAQEVGENFVVLVPKAALDALPPATGRGSAGARVYVVTGSPKAPIKVGTCKTGEFRPQDVDVVDPSGKVLGKAEVVLIDWGYRNDPAPFTGIQLPLGTRLGSFGGGGECGPGYAGYTGHVYAQ